MGLNKDFLGHIGSSDRLRPRTGLGPSLLFWAGPHNNPSKLQFLISFRGEKRGFDITNDEINYLLIHMCGGSYFWHATIYEARLFTLGGFMSPLSNGKA